MRIHSAKKIKKLKELRRRGYSINELVKELSVPRTTVWHHIHKIEVLPQYISLLNSKRGGSASRKQKNLEIARIKAGRLLKSSNREFVIALAMLYWGEGSKKVCELINTDGKIIQVYLKILREVFNIQNKSLKITVRIFSGMDRARCINYWSKITKISKNKFKVRLNDGGTKCRAEYGMCRVTVKRGHSTLKLIHSLIDEIYSRIVKV